jgi:hypothetical protein
MGTGRFSDETVAMSESIGIALLVGLTVVMTAVVGLNVLVVPEEGSETTQANFTYSYVSESEALIVTHSRGDELRAGNVEFRGPGENVTWAEVANKNETDFVAPGDAAQLSEGNAYDQRVSAADTIRIYYNESGNRTQLDQWTGN